MVESIDPKVIQKPVVRCSSCDAEVKYYNTFFSPTNEPKAICWECLMRDEKRFNMKKDFVRKGRAGVIPR